MSSSPLLARKYKYASRFIDDQLNLNDDGEFGRSYHLIYRPELELKCESNGNDGTYLELAIHIKDGQFVYKLFDKRDGFPFEIVRMPDLTGNIPEHIFYGTFSAECLRISRATLMYEDFEPRIKQIYKRMCNQGGNSKKLIRTFKKVIL